MECRPRRDDEILKVVVRNGRIGAQILDLQREADVVVETRIQGSRHPPLSIRAGDEGRDDRVRYCVRGVGKAGGGRERPQRARMRERGRRERIGQPGVDREIVESVRSVGRIRVGVGDAALPRQAPGSGNQPRAEDIADPLAAALAAGGWIILGIIEVALAKLDPRRDRQRLVDRPVHQRRRRRAC